MVFDGCSFIVFILLIWRAASLFTRSCFNGSYSLSQYSCLWYSSGTTSHVAAISHHIFQFVLVPLVHRELMRHERFFLSHLGADIQYNIWMNLLMPHEITGITKPASTYITGMFRFTMSLHVHQILDRRPFKPLVT
jgi:hypothetical protein